MMTTLCRPLDWWEARARKSASDAQIRRPQPAQRVRTYPLWMWRSGVLLRVR